MIELTRWRRICDYIWRDFVRAPVESLYYLAYVLYSLHIVVDRSIFSSYFFIPAGIVSNCLLLASLLLLTGKFLAQKMTIDQWLICGVMLFIFGVSTIYSNELWLFMAVFFIVTSKDISIHRMIILAAATSGIFVAWSYAAVKVGLATSLVFERNGEVRYALAFVHPNTLGMYLLVFAVSITALYFRRCIWLPVLALAVCALLNLTFTGSRTAGYISVVAIFLFLVLRAVPRYVFFRNATAVVLASLCLAMIVVSIYGMLYFSYDIPLMRSMNTILSSRLSLAHRYFEATGMQIFGNDMLFSGVDLTVEGDVRVLFLVDNTFCHMLLRNGVLPTIVFLTMLLLTIVILSMDVSRLDLVFGLVVYFVYALTETLGVHIEANVFLIALGSILIFREGRVNLWRNF